MLPIKACNYILEGGESVTELNNQMKENGGTKHSGQYSEDKLVMGRVTKNITTRR